LLGRVVIEMVAELLRQLEPPYPPYAAQLLCFLKLP
jgi:hypothetical protein